MHHANPPDQPTADRPTPPRVLVLNGGSSSGKSTLTRALQEVLPGIWLRLSVDTLVEASPPALLTEGGLHLADDGAVVVGAAFTEIERFWMAGIARMAELGAHVLVEDGFVSGPAAQARWQQALDGVHTGWVGVRCDAVIAAGRERERGDRIHGMAAQQAETVHAGIHYDLEVDSGLEGPQALAERIRAHWFGSSAQAADGGG